MDKIDVEILKLLQKDTRISHKELGMLLNMSGQAIGQRIHKLEDQKIIEKFTLKINYPQQQLIRIFLDKNQNHQFEKLVHSYEKIDTFYRLAGNACYGIIAHFTKEQLIIFLADVSKFARYSVEEILSDL